MRSDDARSSRKAMLFSSVFLIISGWAAAIFFALGPGNVISAFQSGDPSLIHGFGSFGAAFGVLAALFAGWAAVSVVLSLEVQQTELHELRKQMELDRDLSTFTRLLEIARGVRSNLKDKRPGSDLQGGDVVHHYFNRLKQLRKLGCFDVDDALNAMRTIMQNDQKNLLNSFNLSFLEYFDVLEEITTFLAGSDKPERGRFRILLKSAISFRDLAIFHDHLLLNRSSDVVDMLIRSELFYGGGLLMYEKLNEGPLFPPEVYGPNVLAKIKKGEIKRDEFRYT